MKHLILLTALSFFASAATAFEITDVKDEYLSSATQEYTSGDWSEAPDPGDGGGWGGGAGDW